MNPVKVFTKAIIVWQIPDDPSRYFVTTFVDGKVSAARPARPHNEAVAFAEQRANNDNIKERRVALDAV